MAHDIAIEERKPLLTAAAHDQVPDVLPHQPERRA